MQSEQCVETAARRDTILVVDDVELNRVILSEAFREGYRLLEAENGRQALDLVLAEPDRICAILLDVVMPVMDGFAFLEEMRARDLLARIPVFLITADSSESNMRRGYDLGAVDIIGKPVLPYFVRRRVESVVELYRAREQLGRRVEQQAEEIQQLGQSIIESLATAIEFRSGESGEHVRRISALTTWMLEELRACGYPGCNFTDEQISQIATASILHDVGKIAVPDQVLNKPGRLTAEEFELMKIHTVRGCELLEQIPQYHSNPLFRYAYDICRHHHERVDGRGYPDGLKGEELSIWSQVVALADVYDALTNKRVYKPAFTHEKAMEMIRTGQCGQFQPVLVDALAQGLEHHARIPETN